MGMKIFLKRFVAAFGAAACEELDKNTAPIPPHDLSNVSAERIDSTEVNELSHDFTTLPPGYDPREFGDEL